MARGGAWSRKPPIPLDTPSHPALQFNTDSGLNQNIPREAAPRPYPIRNWKRLDAQAPRWSKAAFNDALKNNADALHRDAYTRKQHLKAWQVTEELHRWARKHNRGIPRVAGLHLVSGPMGCGKSLFMTAVAWMGWSLRAVPVYSNMSLRFGYQISGAGIYHAIEAAPEGSIVVLDEVAALLDSYSGGSNRSRSLVASLTAFRKKHILLLCGSANQQSIASDIRRNAECVIRPMPYHPRIAGGAYMRQGENPYQGMFVFLQAFGLEEPWEGVRVEETAVRHQFLGAKEVKKAQENPYSGKFREIRTFHPGIYNFAAMTSDTLDRVPVGDAHEITRDHMIEDLRRIRLGIVDGEAIDRTAPLLRDVQRNPDPIQFLLWWINSREFRPGGTTIAWKDIQDRAAVRGVRLDQTAIRAALDGAGVKTSRLGVGVEALLAWGDSELGA